MLSELVPTLLDEETFQQLVQSSGLAAADDAGNLALLDRIAEVKALFDAVPAKVREALLIGFLDALTRPVRAG